MESDRGYLYVVQGDDSYLREAAASATSLRNAAPNAHATLVVDRPASQLAPDVSRCFDKIISAPDESDIQLGMGYSFKVRHMYSLSPYSLTCFMDSDTFVVEDTTRLFDLLTFYDFVITQSPGDLIPVCDSQGKELFGYTSYNTGVIYFRKSDATSKFFDMWWHYQRRKNQDDQPTFMQALLESPCRAYVTQPTFNARLPFLNRFKGKVRVVHSRPSQMSGLSLADAARRVNRTEDLRLWIPMVNECLYLRMSFRRWLLVAAKVSFALVSRNMSWARSYVRTVVPR
jgi:hypothetical protein